MEGKAVVSIEALKQPRTFARTAEAGNTEAVAISDLDTASYQRGLKLDFVSKLLPFDMQASGYILVSRRENGKLYVIDGQHRVAAALRSGETHILAQVLEGLTLQEEAQLRIKSNHRKGELMYEKFKARLVAEDPVAIGIKRIVEEQGGEINLTGMQGRTHFVALAAAEKLYNFDGTGRHFARVLNMIGEAFGQLNSSNASANSLYGLSYFMQTHPEADLDRLLARLAEEGTAAMLRRANGYKVIYGGSLWTNWYRAAVEVYNNRLSAAKRLEWKGAKHKLIQHPTKNGGPEEGATVEDGETGEAHGNDDGAN